MPTPSISIIIPTHNRFEDLRRTLEAIDCQPNCDPELEVIVVDDDSTDNTRQLAQIRRSCQFIYLPQAKVGATAARNIGASAARGRILVFMDDDIELMPGGLEALTNAHMLWPSAIVLGRLVEPMAMALVDRSSEPSVVAKRMATDEFLIVSYSQCKTGLLCIGSEEFYGLGMFQDPTGIWPNWDDLDFGYRASKAGHQILLSKQAWAVHHDAGSATWEKKKQREYCFSMSAARLFARYPGMNVEIGMFLDKEPIDWKHDSPLVIARKLMKNAAALTWSMSSAETLRLIVEDHPILEPVQHFVERWIISAQRFRGYRDGLRTLPGADRLSTQSS